MMPNSKWRAQGWRLLGILSVGGALAGCGVSQVSPARDGFPGTDTRQGVSRVEPGASPASAVPTRALERAVSEPGSENEVETAAPPPAVAAGPLDGRIEFAVLPYSSILTAPATLGQSDDDLLVEEQPIRPGGESSSFGDPERTGIVALRGGVGFTASPDTFLLAAEANYFATPQLGLGPLVQLGFTSDRLIFAPTLNFRGVFDIPEPAFEPVKPYVQGGLGFAYLYKDGRRGDNDDLGFLVNFGGGVDFYVTKQIAVGSSMLFNFTPDKTLGDHYFFSWQLLTLTFGF